MLCTWNSNQAYCYGMWASLSAIQPAVLQCLHLPSFKLGSLLKLNETNLSQVIQLETGGVGASSSMCLFPNDGGNFCCFWMVSTVPCYKVNYLRWLYMSCLNIYLNVYLLFFCLIVWMYYSICVILYLCITANMLLLFFSTSLRFAALGCISVALCTSALLIDSLSCFFMAQLSHLTQ